MKRVYGLIIESKPYLTNAEIKSLFKIDEGILTPDRESNLLARHYGTAVIQQERKNASRLLLDMNRRTVPMELERLLIELKFPKSNDRHDRRNT